MARKNRYRLKKMIEGKQFTFALLIPNMITLLSLCSGIISFKLSISGRWELALIAIFFSALFDGLDGGVARMLKATSVFGAQLDSLSDFMCFGVVPAFTIYLWKFKDLGALGWISIIAFILCMVIRLARFNAEAILNSQKKHEWEKIFFKGVPAPAGGLLFLLPIILSLEDGFNLKDGIDYYDKFLPYYALFISFLVVSKIPTFSLKRLKINTGYFSFVMLSFGLIIILLISYPWKFLPLFLLCYIFSIIFSIIKFRILKRRQNLENNLSPLDESNDKLAQDSD